MLIIQHSRKRLNAFDVIAKEEGFGRFSVIADTVDEVKMAVEHYYGPGHGNLDVEGCPLCRNRKAYGEKEAQKEAQRTKRLGKIRVI